MISFPLPVCWNVREKDVQYCVGLVVRTNQNKELDAFRLRVVVAVLSLYIQTIICFPKEVFLSIGSNFFSVQSKEDHFWIKRFCCHSIPLVSFLIFVFIAGCVSYNIYNFISYFFLHEKVFRYISVLLLLILQETSSTFVRTYVSPKPLTHATYRTYQIVLSFYFLIVFCFVWSPITSLFWKYVKSEIYKKKRSSRGKWNYFAWQFFFYQMYDQHEAVTGKSLMKC